MPTYEYKCDACGHAFEKFQSMSADPIKKCPICGKNKVRRLISAGAGLIFKGSGFYITDYRDQGYKDKAKADTGEKSDAKPETKTDGAPAAAPAIGDTAKPAADAKPAVKAETPAPAKSEKTPAASRSASKKSPPASKSEK